MENLVGLRFRPTDEELVDDYLRPKISKETRVMSIESLAQSLSVASILGNYLSRIKLKDQVWCFFSRKENKYERGERQIRKTKSGYWKITGQPKAIMRNRVKIGLKRILMFYYCKELGGSKSHWVMHEYHVLSPHQMIMTYTICKLMFKGEEREISSSSGGSEIEKSHSSIPHLVNNSGGSEGSALHSQELQNSSQLIGGFLDVQEKAQLDDEPPTTPSEEEWENWLNDDFEPRNDRNDYRPPKSLTGVFIDHSSDDNDSDFLSPITNSIENSSSCDSFGCSNHRIDQIKDFQESPNSTIKLVSLTQEVSQTPRRSIDTTEIKKMNPSDDARAEIGELKVGQETIKNKRAGFFQRMIQKFVNKIRLCSSISRT